MSENDYIAEYIKERYPRLLGVEFVLWKFGKAIQTMAKDIAKVFNNLTPEEREEALKEAADEEEEEEAGEES